MISCAPSLEAVAKLFQAALECSLFIAPREPGLSYEELREVGRRVGLKDGEINDVLHCATNYASDSRHLLPDQNTLNIFSIREDPDYRDFEALDFVITQMNSQIREAGGRAAQLDRDVLVERAVAAEIDRLVADAAITLLVWGGPLEEKDGVLRMAHGLAYQPLPTEQRDQPGGFNHIYQRSERTKVYPIVQDVIDRRSDGRPKAVEPLDAFAEQMDRLGYGSLRIWWVQTVRELRVCEPQMTPVAACVLAAALVEGALTFLVRHARRLDLAVLRSSTFDRDARTWRIDDLVASAASGGEAAILDSKTRARADMLIRTRQRIHAGRMLSDDPGGLPDLRPEEARDAKATADLVVRAVLDWLEKFPPSSVV